MRGLVEVEVSESMWDQATQGLLDMVETLVAFLSKQGGCEVYKAGERHELVF